MNSNRSRSSLSTSKTVYTNGSQLLVNCSVVGSFRTTIILATDIFLSYSLVNHQPRHLATEFWVSEVTSLLDSVTEARLYRRFSAVYQILKSCSVCSKENVRGLLKSVVKLIYFKIHSLIAEVFEA